MDFQVDYSGLAFLAMGLAVLASFVLGFVWYHPKVFGTAWGKALGLDMEKKPSGAEMGRNMVLMLLGAAFTAFVFWVTVQAFTPDAWLHDGDRLTLPSAVTGAFFVWLGFKLPLVFNQVTWEGHGMALLWINGAYHLVQLAVIALIFYAFLA